MSSSQITSKVDTRKTKQQLIKELRSYRRQLAAAQRRASGANTDTKAENLQEKLDNLSLDYSLLSEIIDVSADAIISIDQNYKIIHFNQGAQNIFGHSRQEVMGSNIEILLPGEVRAAHSAHIQGFERSDSVSRLMQERRAISARRKDGTIFPARASISKVTSSQGTTLTVFLRDISEFRQAEDRNNRNLEILAHANRLNVLGEISASLAHELNQPLTAILTNAQVIKQQIVPSSTALSAETLETLSDIIHDAKRAANVIQRLRSLSERREQHFESVDISSLIIETESLLRSQLLMRQTQLSTEFESVLPKVLCDPVQLQQVILNLLTNAMDAVAQRNAKDRRILIGARFLESEKIEIFVTDNGTGLKNESSQSIMQPFFTTKENGMGMGLAISKSILENFGGEISAENNRGSGATFHCTLPVYTRPVAISRAGQTRELKPDISHMGVDQLRRL